MFLHSNLDFSSSETSAREVRTKSESRDKKNKTKHCNTHFNMFHNHSQLEKFHHLSCCRFNPSKSCFLPLPGSLGYSHQDYKWHHDGPLSTRKRTIRRSQIAVQGRVKADAATRLLLGSAGIRGLNSVNILAVSVQGRGCFVALAAFQP